MLSDSVRTGKEGREREKRDQSFAERVPAPVETVRWSGEVTVGWPAIRGASAIHHRSIFSAVLPPQPVGTVKESYLRWEKSEKRARWEGDAAEEKKEMSCFALLPWRRGGPKL